ncbi:hypothetical protein TrLO_g4958 [Triparma laevis f. longispina]|uniref:Uncharacterized protein n=1 Tax=Triparma laevis f. longispina TaxID=1714387 RepID=A0A9W7KZQ1_9STRA|nr:hypothetical protein TrLO_g4958 [Triparma laevis f. longispina]
MPLLLSAFLFDPFSLSLDLNLNLLAVFMLVYFFFIDDILFVPFFLGLNRNLNLLAVNFLLVHSLFFSSLFLFDLDLNSNVGLLCLYLSSLFLPRLPPSSIGRILSISTYSSDQCTIQRIRT